MTPDILSVIIALAIMVGALPYVLKTRHPQQSPLAAYLIFLTAFVVGAGILYVMISSILSWLQLGNQLDKLIPAILFVVAVFLPPAILSTWLIRKPPRRVGPPG